MKEEERKDEEELSDNEEFIKAFFEDLAERQISPDPEATKLLNDNLWDLV